MMRKTVLLMFAAVIIFSFAACSKQEKETSVNAVSYSQISQSEAKRLMETQSDYVILDVRTEEEFAAGHIPGAILIPDYEIEQRASVELTDKGQLILVYCRSGRRSKLAAEKLVSMGYTNIREFGGINDWEFEIEV